MTPINTKKRINGNKKRNQDIPLYPLLQKKFKIKVHTSTYINLIINMKSTFGTWMLKVPMLYFVVFPKFCAAIAEIITNEMIKYKYAGVHIFFKSIFYFVLYIVSIYYFLYFARCNI